MDRRCSVNTIAGYINGDLEKCGPLPNEIKKEILSYLSSELLKQNSTTIIDSDTIPLQTGTSHYFASRLQHAFFNEPSASSAEMTYAEAEKATSHKANVNRLAGLSLFATTSADADDESKKETVKTQLNFMKSIYKNASIKSSSYI